MGSESDNGVNRDTKGTDTAQSSLNVLYTNAQRIVNKMDEMKAIVAITNPDILIITDVDE